MLPCSSHSGEWHFTESGWCRALPSDFSHVTNHRCWQSQLRGLPRTAIHRNVMFSVWRRRGKVVRRFPERSTRFPSLVRDGLYLRVAYVHSESVGKVVSRFHEFHATAGKPQVESSVPRRRFIRVRQMVRQTVECCGWTGDLEGVIVRTLDARAAWRT